MAEAVLVLLPVVAWALVVLLAGRRKMNRRYAHAADVSIRCRLKGAHVRATKQLPNAVMRPNRIRCKRGIGKAPLPPEQGQTKATHGDIPNVAATHTHTRTYAWSDILPWWKW